MDKYLKFDRYSFFILKYTTKGFSIIEPVICKYEEDQLDFLLNWQWLVVAKTNAFIYGYSNYCDIDKNLLQYFNDQTKFKHLASGIYYRYGQIMHGSKIKTVRDIIPLEINIEEKTVKFNCVEEINDETLGWWY